MVQELIMEPVKNTSSSPQRRYGGVSSAGAMDAHSAASEFHKNVEGDDKTTFTAVMFRAGSGASKDRRREFMGSAVRPAEQGGRHGVTISDGVGSDFVPNESIQELHFLGK
jgi:hypothetical protein